MPQISKVSHYIPFFPLYPLFPNQDILVGRTDKVSGENATECKLKSGVIRIIVRVRVRVEDGVNATFFM